LVPLFEVLLPFFDCVVLFLAVPELLLLGWFAGEVDEVCGSAGVGSNNPMRRVAVKRLANIVASV
jgi:hypothetical protein